MDKTPKPRADWEAIERDYRTGTFSDHELAAKHGNVVTRQAISKRAKEKFWTKDLTAAVRQATRAKVIAAQVAERVDKEVAETVAGNVAESVQKTVDVVDAMASINAVLQRRHQRDWGKASEVAFVMLGELGQASLTPEQADLLAHILTGEGAAPSDLAQARQAVQKALGLTSRINSIKAIAEALTKIQAGQRIAHGMDGAGDDDPDKPADLSPNDIARRIAFALAKGMKETP